MRQTCAALNETIDRLEAEVSERAEVEGAARRLGVEVAALRGRNEVLSTAASDLQAEIDRLEGLVSAQNGHLREMTDSFRAERAAASFGSATAPSQMPGSPYAFHQAWDGSPMVSGIRGGEGSEFGDSDADAGSFLASSLAVEMLAEERASELHAELAAKLKALEAEAEAARHGRDEAQARAEAEAARADLSVAEAGKLRHHVGQVRLRLCARMFACVCVPLCVCACAPVCVH